MTDNQLLPCPFCGCDAQTIYALYDQNQWHVYCKNCGANVPDYDGLESDVIAAWNRRAEPKSEPLTCKGCVDAVDGKPCDAISCIRGSWLGLADHYRRKPEGMVNDTLEKELAEANRERRDAINELCHKCGRYREEHNGACDGCRWHHGKA